MSLIPGLAVQAGRGSALAARPHFAPAADTTAYELIAAVNSVRVSNGLPALIEDGIINAVAQATAETMAASQMSWHIGDVRGRLAAAGYGGGATVWGTENFATGNYAIDEIMVIWSDADHMIPMVNPAYCHVGAGVARSSNGRSYYILQAAYTSTNSCGEYRAPGGSTTGGGSGAGTGANYGVSQLIVPVKLAAPDVDGRIFHEVASGQSLWAIAIAYQVTIRDLETWNNISKDLPLKVGQKLFIPGSNTEGYATPTPVGMVEVSEVGSDGRIYHIVQPYQALFSIAQAYKVSVDSLLALNGIQKDWPLQIGQKLLISTDGDSPAPGKLSPVQQLTPAEDGNYYHTVKSGETLYWIARLYEINLYDLMNWNGLNESSVLRPEQKLVLLVTPPATATATLAPTLAAPPARTGTPPPGGSRLTVSISSPTPNDADDPPDDFSGIGIFGFVLIAMATGGLLLFIFSIRRK